jgi:hypothetical protein
MGCVHTYGHYSINTPLIYDYVVPRFLVVFNDVSVFLHLCQR